MDIAIATTILLVIVIGLLIFADRVASKPEEKALNKSTLTLPNDGTYRVKRITEKTDDGIRSYIEPRLEELWSDYDKLIWRAAVLLEDTELPITIAESEYSVNGVRKFGYYNIYADSVTLGPLDFHSAWDVIEGIELGNDLRCRKDLQEKLENNE